MDFKLAQEGMACSLCERRFAFVAQHLSGLALAYAESKINFFFFI